MAETYAAVMVFVVIFGIVLAVMAILMPFFVFRIREESIETNVLLNKLIRLNAMHFDKDALLKGVKDAIMVRKETYLYNYPGVGSQYSIKLKFGMFIKPTGEKSNEFTQVIAYDVTGDDMGKGWAKNADIIPATPAS